MKNNKNTVKHNFLKNYYDVLQQYTQVKYVRELLVTGIFLVLLSCGYVIFSWYKNRQNSHAFAGLVEISKSYEKSLDAARKQQDVPVSEKLLNPFEDTELLLEAIALQNSGSSLSPFFVFYQAELALQKEGDYAQACKLMKKGLSQLPKKSIYYDMFNLKLIKMLLDSKDEAVQNSALQDLILMADNSENYCYQEALYTRAMYETSQGTMPAAIESWKKLALSQVDKALIPSPFVTQAKETLQSLHIDMQENN